MIYCSYDSLDPDCDRPWCDVQMSTPAPAPAAGTAAPAAAKPKMTTAELMAAVEAKREAQKKAKAAEEAAAAAAGANNKAKSTERLYGTHEVTCDGCNIKPVVGFRYKCLVCPDHDFCEVRLTSCG